VKSLDERAVHRAMDEWAARLLRERPEVEEIVVFGSFAEGRWAPGSDLDVFLALGRADRPIRDRVPDYLPGPFPVGVDLFPFTRGEIEERRGSPVLDAVARSRWRYRRPAP
jgi:predicted nucleotidyltransferase